MPDIGSYIAIRYHLLKNLLNILTLRVHLSIHKFLHYTRMGDYSLGCQVFLHPLQVGGIWIAIALSGVEQTSSVYTGK